MATAVTSIGIHIALGDIETLQAQTHLFHVRREKERLADLETAIVVKMKERCEHPAVVTRPTNFGYDSRDYGARACLLCGQEEHGSREGYRILSEDSVSLMQGLAGETRHLAFEAAIKNTLITELPPLVQDALLKHLAPDWPID